MKINNTILNLQKRNEKKDNKNNRYQKKDMNKILNQDFLSEDKKKFNWLLTRKKNFSAKILKEIRTNLVIPTFILSKDYLKILNKEALPKNESDIIEEVKNNKYDKAEKLAIHLSKLLRYYKMKHNEIGCRLTSLKNDNDKFLHHFHFIKEPNYINKYNQQLEKSRSQNYFSYYSGNNKRPLSNKKNICANISVDDNNNSKYNKTFLKDNITTNTINNNMLNIQNNMNNLENNQNINNINNISNINNIPVRNITSSINLKKNNKLFNKTFNNNETINLNETHKRRKLKYLCDPELTSSYESIFNENALLISSKKELKFNAFVKRDNGPISFKEDKYIHFMENLIKYLDYLEIDKNDELNPTSKDVKRRNSAFMLEAKGRILNEINKREKKEQKEIEKSSKMIQRTSLTLKKLKSNRKVLNNEIPSCNTSRNNKVFKTFKNVNFNIPNIQNNNRNSMYVKLSSNNLNKNNSNTRNSCKDINNFELNNLNDLDNQDNTKPKSNINLTKFKNINDEPISSENELLSKDDDNNFNKGSKSLRETYSTNLSPDQSGSNFRGSVNDKTIYNKIKNSTLLYDTNSIINENDENNEFNDNTKISRNNKFAYLKFASMKVDKNKNKNLINNKYSISTKNLRRVNKLFKFGNRFSATSLTNYLNNIPSLKKLKKSKTSKDDKEDAINKIIEEHKNSSYLNNLYEVIRRSQKNIKYKNKTKYDKMVYKYFENKNILINPNNTKMKRILNKYRAIVERLDVKKEMWKVNKEFLSNDRIKRYDKIKDLDNELLNIDNDYFEQILAAKIKFMKK